MYRFIPGKRLIAAFSLVLLALVAVATGAENGAATALAKARELAKAGKLQEALIQCDEAIQLDPQSGAAYYERGLLFLRMGKQVRPMEDFTEAIRLKPDYAEAYFERARLHEEAKQYREAIADLNKAIEYKPRFARAYSSRGNNHLLLYDMPKAFKDLDEAIKLDPKDAEAWFRRGRARFLLQQAEPGLKDYDQAIKLRPDYDEALHLRGTYYTYSPEPAKGLPDLNEAIRLKPKEAWYYLDRADCLIHLNRLDDAWADLDTVLRLNSGYDFAYKMRGIIYEQRGQYDKALEELNHAIRMNGSRGSYYYHRALSRVQLGQSKEEALKDLNRSLELGSEEGPDWALSMRAFVFSQMGQHQRSLADYNQVLGRWPNWLDCLSGRFFVYVNLNKYDQAVEDGLKLLQTPGYAGDQSGYMGMLVYLFRQKSDEALARRILDQAFTNCEKKWPYPVIQYLHGDLSAEQMLSQATNNDQKTEAYSYLGFALLNQGKKEEARKHFQWVRQNGNTNFVEYRIAGFELKEQPAGKKKKKKGKGKS